MRTHSLVRRNSRSAVACGSDVTRPGCDTYVPPTCDVQMVTGVLRGLATATGNTLTMAPLRTNYFQALSEKLEVIDATNPDINRRVEVQTIEINRIPQEPFSDALAAANTAAALSDFFGPAFDGFGKPVAYGIYAQAALIHVFQYGFWNIESVSVDIYAAHFGNSLSAVPPGLSVGQPFNQ